MRAHARLCVCMCVGALPYQLAFCLLLLLLHAEPAFLLPAAAWLGWLSAAPPFAAATLLFFAVAADLTKKRLNVRWNTPLGATGAADAGGGVGAGAGAGPWRGAGGRGGLLRSLLFSHPLNIIFRVGQIRIYTPYMTVYLVISLPKLPYIHRIYMILANPNYFRQTPETPEPLNKYMFYDTDIAPEGKTRYLLGVSTVRCGMVYKRLIRFIRFIRIYRTL